MVSVQQHSKSGKRQPGAGLIEVLVAVLIFATGMMGLVSAQVAGKRAGYEAGQRSIATALARDILERMRANPGQLAIYSRANLGDRQARLPAPAVDCATANCLPAELATYDLWQWESQLVGVAEQHGTRSVGGLVSPRACISRDAGAVAVTISWWGTTSASSPPSSACGSEIAGLYDDPTKPAGNNLRRRAMTLSTFVAAQ